jgi:hypothetical protein
MKLVRAVLENGSDATMNEAVARKAGYTIIDAPTHDSRGRIRDPEFPETPAPEGYEALTITRLRELVDERNESREDSDKLLKGGSKADIAGRLTADDNAHSDS